MLRQSKTKQGKQSGSNEGVIDGLHVFVEFISEPLVKRKERDIEFGACVRHDYRLKLTTTDYGTLFGWCCIGTNVRNS